MTTAKTTLIAAGLLLAIATTASLAQSAKPGAAKPVGKTLGGKASGGGKLMTRDELRTCLRRLDDVNKGSQEVAALRPALDREREELQQGGEALKGERAELDRRLAAVRDWESRLRAHAAEVEVFNTRSAQAQEAPRNRQEALAAELKAERERLQKARDALGAEEATLVPTYQSAVKAYNERATARDARVVDWNQRNASATNAAIKHDEARASWLAECANRPYLEDDEKAIKAGK